MSRPVKTWGSALLLAIVAMLPLLSGQPTHGVQQQRAEVVTVEESAVVEAVDAMPATASRTPQKPASAPERPLTAMDCSWEDDALSCGDCRSDGDCPEGMGCVPDLTTHRTECRASECVEAADCPQGERCAPLNDGTETRVRACAPAGAVELNEPCMQSVHSATTSCGPDLVCSRGACRHDCHEDPSRCPQGTTCLEGDSGWACDVVECAGVQCPEGATCSQGFCIKGEDCSQTGCTEGQECIVSGGDQNWRSACMESCGGFFGHQCKDGVCGSSGVCHRTCDPREADACEKGWICSTVDEERLVWGCRLDGRQ